MRGMRGALVLLVLLVAVLDVASSRVTNLRSSDGDVLIKLKNGKLPNLPELEEKEKNLNAFASALGLRAEDIPFAEQKHELLVFFQDHQDDVDYGQLCELASMKSDIKASKWLLNEYEKMIREEEEERLKREREEEERLRREREEEERLRREREEEEQLRRKQEEEQLRRKQEEEQLRRKQEEEQLRRKQEEEQLRRKQEEEQLRRKQEEEQLRREQEMLDHEEAERLALELAQQEGGAGEYEVTEVLTTEDGRKTEWLVVCPHCRGSSFVNKEQLNCHIFRHGNYKDSGKHINPHMPKPECDRLVREGLVEGCAKPFKVIKKGKNKDLFTVACEYI